MIKTELLEGDFIRTWSDAGFFIRGGSPEGLYAEAVDPAQFRREYVETDIPIDGGEETEDEEATVEDYQAALEKLGVSIDGEED